MVFIRFPAETKARFVYQDYMIVDTSQIQSFVSSYLGNDDYKIYYNGKELLGSQEVFRDETVHVTFSLPGGKGGFGSMLRAIGAQIEKTTNREACRDLSGRRLRDINEEQRLKKWISKEAEREEEKIRRRKERIERLKAKPRHNFVDFEYEKVISELPERIDDALTAGLQKTSKRPIEAGESSKASSSKKKKSLWLGEDLSDSSESDAESCDKTNSSKDTDCSNSSTQNEKISRTLTSEASGSESSNFSTNCEQPPNPALDPVLHMETSEDKEASTTAEVSPTEAETPVISLSLQDKEPSDGGTNETSVQETQNNQETQNQDDDSPIDLLSFNTPEELEALGLNRLKIALMTRGLKCGGNISDRALRLWKVRDLQPHEYPKNLLAKGKK